MTKQITLAVDKEALADIDALKKEFGAKTTAAVFRKALAIARIAAEQAADSGGIVAIRGRNQDKKDEISIAIRA